MAFQRAVGLTVLILLLLLCSTWSLQLAYRVLNNWLDNALPLIPLSLAAGLIISCGQIDIASGSVFGLAGMTTLFLMSVFPVTLSFGWSLSWLATIATYGAVFGLVVYGKIPALLCTFGISFCAQSFSVLISKWMSDNSQSLVLPIKGPIAIFGWSWMWTLVVLAVLFWWRHRTIYGLEHIAVGIDADAARIAGVSINSVYAFAFLSSGFLVGVSSLTFMIAYSQGGWAVNTGWGKELFAIAAAVIGGSRITGGRFEPLTISLATVLMAAIREVVVGALRMPAQLESLFLGIALILIALLDFSDRPQSPRLILGWIGGRKRSTGDGINNGRTG